MKKQNLPALDDEDLRKLNNKKVISAIENVGSYVKTAQTNTRIAIVTGIVFLSILLLIVCGSYAYMFVKTEGEFLNAIFQVDAVTNRFSCGVPFHNATFVTPKEALEYKELFKNSSCDYYSLKK